MYQLRDYQKDACRQSILKLNKHQRVLLMLPTGAGKTVIGSSLIDFFVSKGLRVLYIVNRQELVDQSVDKFGNFLGEVSIIKAGRKYKRLYNPEKKVQIIMIQTYFARRSKLPNLNPDVIIIDESHEGFHGSRVQTLIQDYPNAKILAKTATPCDEKGHLMEGFDAYIQELQIADLQQMGYLVQDRAFAPVDIDLTSVKMSGNDYNEGELSDACSEVVTNVVDNFKKLANDKLTLVFAVDIYHAEKLTEEFRKEGYKAEVIHSKMEKPEQREHIINAFAKREIQILVNVGVLTTGFDCPATECVILARPTKVLRLYIQMVGRGLRTKPVKCPYCGQTSYLSFKTCEHCGMVIFTKKTECLFLDCGGCLERFGFPSEDRYFEPKPNTPLGKKKKKEDDEENEKVLICLFCKAVNPVDRRECVECGALLQAPLIEIENEQELKEVKKPEYTWEAILKFFIVLVKQRGQSEEYAKKLYGMTKGLKPQNMTEDKFIRMVLTRIKHCVNKKYKVYWIYKDLQDHFNGKETA